MNVKQLNKIIKYGEDSKTEFKQIFCEGVYKTICAFINSNGGMIFVGIDDDGVVVGYNPSKKSLDSYREETLQWQNVYITDEIVNVGRRKLFVIQVCSKEDINSNSTLAKWKGNQYKRIGSSTKVCN
ncbi:MAG: ATP-binding protein [Caldisericia bacterium]|nr:ATP-binding protein [Caldisericia bacterium]